MLPGDATGSPVRVRPEVQLRFVKYKCPS